ncbi:hypothetical protein MJO28_003451 [Puccinia striiformis f. sp. tritici]|uniref:Uncharacterized protein n=1 Tax=Puccinia striiformis f. sp. tritici TaxID=168172 RepID=A0ACC0EW94_9BASI|nr:hypothetical protein MJO28_003451 [Puccinia striiformis f. sp. tritici]
MASTNNQYSQNQNQPPPPQQQQQQQQYGQQQPQPQQQYGQQYQQQQQQTVDSSLSYGLSNINLAQNPQPDGTPAKSKRPARAFHQETQPSTATGLNSPMPPRSDLNANNSAFRHRPDRPEHQQRYQHQPMSAVPPGPPIDQSSNQQSNSIQPLFPQPNNNQQRSNGPRNRIDPNQIPSPVIVHEQDAEIFSQEPFRTCQSIYAGSNPQSYGPNQPPPPPPQIPLSLTDYLAIDEGNCSPRFIRATTYCLPAMDDIAQAAELPLGLVIQPLAELGQGEGDMVPMVNFSEDPTGPPRCSSCRGYINPWCTFIDGGHRFKCNLCGKPSDVPAAYFCHLDMSGRRVDHYQRPELCRGSVDFIVNQDYWVQSDSSDSKLTGRVPQPMKYLFAIDVSWSAIKSGMLQQITKSIKSILFNQDPEEQEVDDDLEFPSGSLKPTRQFPVGAQVGFITFDRTVHFYNLKAGLDQAQMLVVPDLDDMFVPISEDALYVDPAESSTMIHNLLDSLPAMFAENNIMESALGGPVQAAFSSLKRLGGQVNIFLTSLPTIGPGGLKQREDTKLYNTEKENTLFNPVDPWYRQVAEECSLAGIGINMFLFPSQYIDVATISVLSGITGGEVFFHPRFDPQRDCFKVHSELRRVLTRETAASVTMRIRCSNGLRISEHFGSFLQRNVTDLEFGNLDADKAIAAILKIEGKLEDNSSVDAQFQCALLYTSATGQRRVRCHNLTLPVTRVIGNIFRSADMDATMALLTKQYIAQIVQVPLRDVRATLTESCVKILLAYRKHCASSTSPGQLILPESYKLFPLYALGLMKTKAVKGGNVSSDVRTHYMRYLKSLGVPQTILMLYPRMIPIHKLDEIPDACQFNPDNQKFILPPLMRASYLRMEADGIYLIENGDMMIMWIGSGVSPEVLTGLFGVSTLESLDPKLYASRLPKLNTLLSTKVRRLLKFFDRRRGDRSLPLLVSRQSLDSTEFEFANLLVEDQNNDAMSYVDYLCFVHKQIQNDLSGTTGSNGSTKTYHHDDNQNINQNQNQNQNGVSQPSFIDPGSLWRAAW